MNERKLKVYVDGKLVDGFKTSATYQQGEQLGLEIINKGKIEKVKFTVVSVIEEIGATKLICLSN